MSKFIDIGTSRFFQTSDISSDTCIYKIAPEWWSRIYEYPWATQFAEPDDVCLDAACGVGHHLKFYLAKNCNHVYCCDIDPIMENPDAIFNVIKDNWGIDVYNSVLENAPKMDFKCSNISKLTYSDKMFDKIYCISVLEHLDQDTMSNAFMEFNRILKDDGFMVLTFDHPSINLDNLNELISNAGLKFAYDVNFEIPSDALESSDYFGLKCFRALLTKNNI